MKHRLTIVQVSTFDRAGGAEKVAYSLHCIYRQRGHRSILVVGTKRTDDPDVLAINNRFWRRWRSPWKMVQEKYLGRQYLHHPGSHEISKLIGQSWDILHLHNLHGGYFDLATLPTLSRRSPTVLMLHDCWLLTGHCAHPFDCTRWKTGCGACPDLSIYPAIEHDGTAYNWQRKREIFRESEVYITAPSKWLLDRSSHGLLSHFPGRLIYNGVDTTIFRPRDRRVARDALDLPQDRDIVLFSAQQGLENRWKDGHTLLAAFEQMLGAMPASRHPLLLPLGGHISKRDLGSLADKVISRPYVTDEETVAAYYQAANVLAYATRADNCPLVVLEALACALPVVASAVGGIPELITDSKTGFLVPPGNPQAFATALLRVIEDTSLRGWMSTAAADVSLQRFDIQRQADEYLTWYSELLSDQQHTTLL